MLASASGTRRSAWGVQLVAAALAVTLCACSSDEERVRELQAPRREDRGPDRQAVITLVDDAARLIETEGEAAFDDLRAPGSRWRSGDTYVFVVDEDGTMVVHPDPALEGSNVLDLRDANGKPFVREYMNLALRDGAGWTDYSWLTPGGGPPAPKLTYVKRVDVEGRTYVVGSGVYLE